MFEVECIDRMYLNVWVPRLAVRRRGCMGFFVGQPRSPTTPPRRRWIQDHRRVQSPTVHRFCRRDDGVALVSTSARQRKDDVMHGEFLARFTGAEGVLFVGRAQEKASLVWRTRETSRRPGRGSLCRGSVQLHGVRQPLLLLLPR